jgi:DivIVA domain-containing protein
MVEKKLTSLEILNKKFTADVKGYAALEVDGFLDMVIKDYQSMELFIKDAYPKLLAIEKQFHAQKIVIRDLEIENLDLKDKVSVMNRNDTIEINQANYNIVRRLGLLEKELYKLGIDPNKIK